VKTRAEVILTDGGFEIIERRGKDAKAAARMALDRFLATGSNPFETPIFLRIPYRHAEHFSNYGNFPNVKIIVNGQRRTDLVPGFGCDYRGM
jgi:hypothetical protein